MRRSDPNGGSHVGPGEDPQTQARVQFSDVFSASLTPPGVLGEQLWRDPDLHCKKGQDRRLDLFAAAQAEAGVPEEGEVNGCTELVLGPPARLDPG